VTKKTLYMETTEIAAERSAADVSSELIKAGATQIASTYEAGKIVGLRWTMRVNGAETLFEMPARVFPIYKILMRRVGYDIKVEPASDKRNVKVWEKAERVAWRQLLRWVQAQNAMIETGMVQPAEVFNAYWIPPGHDKTLFQLLTGSQFKLLPPAGTQ